MAVPPVGAWLLVPPYGVELLSQSRGPADTSARHNTHPLPVLIVRHPSHLGLAVRALIRMAVRPWQPTRRGPGKSWRRGAHGATCLLACVIGRVYGPCGIGRSGALRIGFGPSSQSCAYWPERTGNLTFHHIRNRLSDVVVLPVRLLELVNLCHVKLCQFHSFILF